MKKPCRGAAIAVAHFPSLPSGEVWKAPGFGMANINIKINVTMKLRNLFLAALPLLTAACSEDGSDGAGNRTPMTFSSSIQAVSRLTVNESWAGQAGSEVGVQIGDAVKKYVAGDDGSLTSDAPFYWEDFTGTVTASAWYPYTEGGKPAVTVAADQSVPANYLASDLLEAAEVEVAPANSVLTFTHRTAKVECSLKLAEGEEGTMNGATVILLNLTGVDNGTSVTTNGDLHALVAPQTVSAGTAFVEVRMENGGSHVGTLESNLELKAGYITPIELEITPDKVNVNVGESQVWTGGSQDVSSESPNVKPSTEGGEWTGDGETLTPGSDSPTVAPGQEENNTAGWGSDGSQSVDAEKREKRLTE